MPDQRQAAHERNLLDIRALRGDDDAAITTVPPSATVTLVSADWYSEQEFPKRGEYRLSICVFSTSTSMNTVLRRDLRGDFQFSARRQMNCTEIVLLIVV